MDRNIVYPGSIPLDTDLLALNRNTMIAIGYLARAVLGTDPVLDGLACTATTPASMQVILAPGSITQVGALDVLDYGSLPADTATSLLKMGINTTSSRFTLAAPAVSGQVNTYLIQATLQESDTVPIVLPYYNAANPSQPFSGPAGSGNAQPTLRTQRVGLQLKLATASSLGAATVPPVDVGWIGLYAITVRYGQTSVTNADIASLASAPFAPWKMPSLRPGFGSGVQSFTANDTFVVPQGVRQVEVEVWGAGAGSFASVSGRPSGGGAAGGYARKRISGLTPGQSIPVGVGSGGSAGVVGGNAPSAGGTSSFGNFTSATGGSLNYLANQGDPRNGGTPAGCGINGDVNLMGSAGQGGYLNQGGMGGAAPMGGAQNSGTTGVPGVFPGGGASGAGTGADSATPYNGAAGASGLVVVRW
ncbi:MAG: hypothetical protein J0H67_03625 [Rhodospirillales bacterium]|nr:hypothetical protein [Rhodospirillales bacterium]